MTSLQLDPPSTSRYRASLLGPFTLERDGSILGTSMWQRRVESLFKLLIIAPAHRRSRDEILEQLWPDAPPETASANLRLLAHRLRLALCVRDPSPVLLEHGWVTLNPAYAWDTDLAHFEDLVQRAGDDIHALEKAASLYRGEPLLEEQYEDWAIPIRERIQRQWRVVTLRLAQLHRSRGSLDQAAQWYERVLEGDPLDEEALQGLLTVLGKLGKRTEALRRYRQFEQRLAAELEVPPEPETRAMVAQLEAQVWQGVAHPEEPIPRPIPFLPSYPLPAAGSCVGRERELAILLEALPASRMIAASLGKIPTMSVRRPSSRSSRSRNTFLHICSQWGCGKAT